MYDLNNCGLSNIVLYCVLKYIKFVQISTLCFKYMKEPGEEQLYSKTRILRKTNIKIFPSMSFFGKQKLCRLPFMTLK